MTITTKYNIGDKVYARINYGKEIVNCEVQDLRATAVFLDPSPTIEYTLRYYVNRELKLIHRFEEEVYPTQEELLKTL